MKSQFTLIALIVFSTTTWAQYTPARAINDAERLKDVFSRKKPKQERVNTPEPASKPPTPVQEPVEDEGQTETEVALDNALYEISYLKEQLAKYQGQGIDDLKPLQNVIAAQDKELQDARATIYAQKRQIDSLIALKPTLIADKPYKSIKSAEKQPEIINLGEMAVVGDNSIRRATDGTITVRTSRSTPRPRVKQTQYYTGPRGGCFYYTSGGNKAYVDRSLCN